VHVVEERVPAWVGGHWSLPKCGMVLRAKGCGHWDSVNGHVASMLWNMFQLERMRGGLAQNPWFLS
jgi:hypothetical protein